MIGSPAAALRSSGTPPTSNVRTHGCRPWAALPVEVSMIGRGASVLVASESVAASLMRVGSTTIT